jgi:large subunit ribosomal protein L9
MSRKSNTIAVTGTTRTSVEVLLAENVQGLGKQGDIIRVKPGYARNFLLPQGLATIATDHNKQMVERHRRRLQQFEVKKKKSLEELAEAVSKYSVTLDANANKENQLYGSIVETDISKALNSAGFDISPEMVALEGPLKLLGMYTVKVQLSPDVQTEVKVWIVPTPGK